ncbi:class I SAM-dependent methyltransferase [Natrarchaeobaculum aegyptiacum]|uniref:SAM-dependent methyltransferase n=1 Tax=Natrarchaeobaculum aegyptiacum TaxID=745377 RepID=A0A2Z2HUM5_9EURY|nr:class I SAM-dependent methyltransferase [Natrarchaeobaculum aegyptiacum]ARS90892.1 SAM-dependent methyltransferase [Natrarchaeobaculum aegyptiacum]
MAEEGNGTDRERRRAVRDTYDRIADHFASTREYAWPEVEAFVAEQSERYGVERADRADRGGDDEIDLHADDDSSEVAPRIGLDLGCGNCRHAEVLLREHDIETVVGLDVSRGLLETGRERSTDRAFEDGLALVQGDASRLPLATNAVAVGVFVATLHHLPSREARRRSLDELGRVLAPEGRALVSAWSTAHDRFDADEGFDTSVDWTLPGGETVDRFYHIYDPDEFEADLEASACRLLEWELSSGNCYATVAGARDR